MRAKKLHFHGTFLTAFWQNIKRLDFEDQVIMGAHAITLVSCFLPWVSFDPLYGPTNFQNAFSGASWLIGWFVFVFSLAILMIYIDQLSEKNIIRLPQKELLFFWGGISSLILIICGWSVIHHVGLNYAGAEMRFGFALCLIAQLASLVSLWLQGNSRKRSQAQDFFKLPTEKKSGQSQGTHQKK